MKLFRLLVLALFPLVFCFAKLDSLRLAAQNSTGVKKVDILLQIVDISASGSADERIKSAYNAYELSEKIGYLNGKALALNKIAAIEYAIGRYENSRVNYFKSFDLYKKNRDSTRIGLVCTEIGYLLERIYKFDSALIYHNYAVRILEKYGTKRDYAIALNNVGMIIWRNGVFAEALPYFSKALEIRKELKSNKGIGMSYNNIGSLYWRWGNYEKALENFQHALVYREIEKDTHGIVLILNNLGLVYQKINQLEKALEYLNDALRISNQSKFTFGKAYTYHNLGMLHSEKKEYNTALQYSLKSLDCYNSIKEMGGIISSLNDLGEYYENMGSLSVAFQYFQKALTTAQDAEDRFSTANTLFNLGRISFKLKDQNKAMFFLEQSIAMAQKQGLKELIMNNYQYLSKIHSEQKNYEKAFLTLSLYNALKDTLYNEKLMTDQANQRVKFETEKKINENKYLRNENILKQAEIEKQKLLTNLLILASFIILMILFAIYRLYYLKKKNHQQIIEQKNELEKLNSLLDSQNKELFEINKTKDKLFSVVAHDLKNPFQALIGYSDILSNELDTLEREKIKTYAKNINLSARNLLSLTRNLLDWARIQSNKIVLQPQEINIKSVLDELISIYHFNIVEKSITVINEINADIKVVADKQMLNTVIRNLLSNAIKFSNNDGFVKTSSEVLGNEVIITIEDSGVGIPENEINLLFNINTNFSRGGTNNEKGTGLGLILCKDFVEKCGGRIWVESLEGKGSKFKFTIPLS